ncbi:type II toxin-antitoxin system VapC family toxin [Mesorhizobium yinganensis]|uniref:type II toxin-antitoxin system VapC family toxin n=1 Tax=Mesorhizobium yinganensis TaxID=3157707 RepID=UPI0032B798E7
MILVDTSIWIDHLREAFPPLIKLLLDKRVATHPFVVGEIALGSLKDRGRVLRNLSELPRTCMAEDHEVLSFVERFALHGRGIGYVDAHLLASVKLTPETLLLTRDKRLRSVAEELGLAMAPTGLAPQ